MRKRILLMLTIWLVSVSGYCGLSGSGVGGVANPLNGSAQQQQAQQQQIYEQQRREAAAAQAQALQAALAQQAEQDRLKRYAVEQQRLADQARLQAEEAKTQATNATRLAVEAQKRADEAQDQVGELQREAERYRTFFIPKDPWRKFEGNKQFVKTSGWMEFRGKVLEVQKGGIRVEGGYGEPFQVVDSDKEFFVVNFPYPVADGESVGLGHDVHAMVAHDAGVCTLANNYTTKEGIAQTTTAGGVSRTTEAETVMGGSHTVRKLDYGTPCERPEDAPKEVVVPDLQPVETEQITAAKLRASEMRQDAVRALQLAELAGQAAMTAETKAVEQARLADEAYQKATESERKIAAEKEKKQQAIAAMQLKVLKLNQDQAARGEPYGLLRMGERYRDGDGVPKDLAKARDYLSKAAAAGEPSAADELSRLDHSTNAPAGK
ncbi:MAG: hypothetical protein ABSC38_08675 [Verrucomicrobiia bacterium]